MKMTSTKRLIMLNLLFAATLGLGLSQVSAMSESEQNRISALQERIDAFKTTNADLLSEAVDRNYPDLLNMLIEKDVVDLNAQSTTGYIGSTPLQIALMQGFYPIANTLLAAGANINARATDGSTAIAYVLDGKPEQRGLLKKFIAAGANVNQADNSGRFPLDMAAQSGDAETVKILLSAGAQTTFFNSKTFKSALSSSMAGTFKNAQVLVDRCTKELSDEKAKIKSPNKRPVINVRGR